MHAFARISPMKTIQANIKPLKNQLNAALDAAATETAVEEIRVSFIGRSGHITNLVATLKDMSADDKRTFGPQLNELKKFAEQAIEQKKQELNASFAANAANRTRNFDVTAYLPNRQHGSLHIYTHIIAQLQDIFISMGFAIGDGPEIETDYYNFQ